MTDAITKEIPDFSADQTSQEISDDEVTQGSDDSEKICERPRQLLFHKENSFPQFCMNVDPLRKNPITLATGLPILSKRLLPPVNVTDAKRFRPFFESPASSINDIGTPRSESVTGKDPSSLSSDVDDSYLRVSIDEYCQSTSSSNSTQELSESTESDNYNSLHEQLFQSLRIGKQYRASPTNSTASLPVPRNASGWSPRDDDANSCASDSVAVKYKSSSKCLPGESVIQPESEESQSPIMEDNSSTKGVSYESDDDGLQFYSIPSNLNEKNHDWLDSESTQEAQEDDRTSPDEEVPRLPHTQSSGILPAIPSHKTRERSYLVGSLTKHGSLLGVEELNRYFPDRMLNIFVGTWNMQKKAVPKNLDDFILPKHKEFLQDIYVIGVQESTQDQKLWEIKLQETLGVNHVLIRSVSHGVLHLSIFVRRDLIWFCSSVEDDKVTTRMVSQVKTKGAVAIGFQFFGTSLLFVNAHFHSGQSKVNERIEDYNKIKEKLKLPRTDKADAYKSSDVTSRYDCTFWFGDLNFRVDLPPSIMRDEIHAPGTMNLKEALKWDQLRAVMKRKSAFHGFAEHRIKFRPTYKLLPDSESYAVSSKPRTPSYTDRILFKTKENDSICCSDYYSVSSVKHSDHRPVYGFFKVSLKPGRDNASVGVCNYRSDVYEKAARLRAQGGYYQDSSSVCNIL